MPLVCADSAGNRQPGILDSARPVSDDASWRARVPRPPWETWRAPAPRGGPTRPRVALALGIALLLLAACSTTRGSGQLATAQREVANFTKVELAGQGDVTIEQTGTESLSISADDNLLPLLTS